MKISFLITHYNRPDDLFECISSIRKLEIANSEIIVSDDASKKECIEIIQQFKVDQLLFSNSNEGLAANINRGIKACSGEYIIYCQEDFVLDSRVSFLINDFIELLNDNKVDMIRFTSNILFNKKISLTKNVVLIPKFSFHNFLQNYYQYSDHPFITKKVFMKIMVIILKVLQGGTVKQNMLFES